MSLEADLESNVNNYRGIFGYVNDNTNRIDNSSG